MGGNALKHLGTERKSAAQYAEILTYILQGLERFCKRATPVPAYRLKPDFGDADILFTLHEACAVEDVKKTIRRIFSPRDVIYNGGVYTFDYDNFQIDLIHTTAELFAVSLNYYSYNDLGNLVGRIAHKMGFKYGHLGLLLPIRKTDSHMGEEIVISRSTGKILTFLGFDVNGFCDGFDTLEDIFEYVITSKYFNKDIFSFENLNHINRTRNRKRKVYAQFLEYLDKREDLPTFEFSEDKYVYLEQAKQYFPEANISLEIDRVNAKIAREDFIRSKFNGDIIQDCINIDKKNLGEFISKFKKICPDEETFRCWVEYRTQEEINDRIRLEYLK